MKMLKTLSFCAALMTAAAAVPMTPVTVFAEEEAPTSGKCGENCTWKLDEATGTLTISGTGETDSYTIDSAAPPPWIGSGSYDFHEDWAARIKAIVIEEGITHIGGALFSDCQNVTSVTLPNSLQAIGYAAFICPKLESITLPNGLKTIEDSFRGSGLTEITLPESLEKIGQGAFNNCRDLKTVTILSTDCVIEGDPEDIISSPIPKDTVIRGYDNSTAQAYAEKYGYTFESLGEAPAKEEIAASGSCGENCTWSFDAESGTLTISGTGEMADYPVMGSDCSNAPWGDFSYMVKNVVLSDQITRIGAGAFAVFISLETIPLPEGLLSIGEMAFHCCPSLSEITIPSSVTEIERNAFFEIDALKSITILNPKCIIADDEMTISHGYDGSYGYDGVIRGYDNSTAETYAKKYGYTFESLGAAPAEEEPVTAATSGICGENMKLKWSYDTATKTLTISGNDRMSMTEFFSAEKGKAGSRAQWKPFAKQMKAVVIEEGVKSISPGAFVADDSESPDDGLLYQNLTSVTIPSSVTEIGVAAFSGTPWLKAQQEKDPMVVVNGILIDGTTASGKVVIPEGVKVIGHAAMFGSEAESVTLPESLTEIQRYAFMHCPNLTGIVLPENVTTLGMRAFEGCEKLTDITVPAGVTDFDARVFDETPWMEAALAANSLVIVNNVVLKANKLAESVEIPETVTKIASFAFRECRHMFELSFPASVQEIGQGALDFNSIGRYTFLNPDCKIHEDNIKSNNITLIGYDGSTAQAFAKTKGYTFVSLGAAPEIEELKGTLSNGTVNWEFDAATKTLSFSGTGDIGHAPWCEFEEILHIQIPEGITEIGSGVFAGDGITEIEIPDTVTKISTYAFTGTSLKEVTLPSSVNEVHGGAFGGCEALTAITILNPECRIGEDEAEFFFAICNDYTEDDATRERTPIYTGVIRGYDGSTAEAYAKKYDYKFESLGAAPAIPKLEPTLRGDLDLTNVVDVSDAVILARYLVGDDSFAVSDQGLANADADGSGKLTTEDVTYIIKMIVGLV